MADPASYLNRPRRSDAPKKFHWGTLHSGRRCGTAYAAGTVIPVEMARDLGVPFPMFYPEYFFNDPRMWMGKKGTVTALHKDIPDNFSFAYFGAKEWLLYPPAVSLIYTWFIRARMHFQTSGSAWSTQSLPMRRASRSSRRLHRSPSRSVRAICSMCLRGGGISWRTTKTL